MSSRILDLSSYNNNNNSYNNCWIGSGTWSRIGITMTTTTIQQATLVTHTLLRANSIGTFYNNYYWKVLSKFLHNSNIIIF